MRPIREELRDPVNRADLDEVYHRLEGSLQAGTSSRSWLLPITAATAVAAIALVVWAVWPAPDPGSVQIVATGAPLEHVEGAAEPVRLSDGSSLELERGTRLSAVENGEARVSLLMSPGRSTFDIEPNGPRAWTIDAGPFAVDVLGTRFTVERADHRGRVSVDRGRVRVRGEIVPGGFVFLGAGEHIELTFGDEERAPDEHTSPAPATATEEPGAPEAPSTPEASEPRPRPAAPEAESWEALAARGAYGPAYSAVEADFDAELERAESVEQLFALADTARLSGHPARARGPLERITLEHPNDRRAGVAAFTLGKIEMAIPGRAAEAERWLSRSLELGLSPSLADAARRRLTAL
ncbi:MAG: FecR domain-containing protein [Deltaproteobacteria bacterium]|nr:FecR domain-containing protein [Deltaproteobacteria bacterium]